jgi:hypothetical protein
MQSFSDLCRFELKSFAPRRDIARLFVRTMLKFELLNYHDQKLTLDQHVEIWEQSVLEVRDRWRTLLNEVMNIRVPLNAGR